jgi:hypothetical protein
MRLLSRLVIFKLGAWLGVMAAAAFVKRAVPSRGDEESDELALVAVFDGIELESRATAFRGGSMLAWFGGIEVDLRSAELAAGARLSVHTLFGGIELTTPPHWRVEANTKALAGGVVVPAGAEHDPDAPVLTLTGLAVFGGVEVRSREPARAVAAADA